MSLDRNRSNIDSCGDYGARKILKNGLSTNVLKYTAIIAMVIDHIANAFIDDTSHLYFIMSCIGRITGPIMFFTAVEGYHHTKNLRKYIVRLFIFAVISYLPFMYAFYDHFHILRLNIIFTILFGILAIHARRNIKNIFFKTVIILLLMIASLPADYGNSCIVTMLILDYYYGNRKNQIMGYSTVVALEFGVLWLVMSPFWHLIYENSFDISFLKESYYLLGYVLPIFFLYFYNEKQGKNNKFSKWFFYIFYPLHLSIIAIIRIFLT